MDGATTDHDAIGRWHDDYDRLLPQHLQSMRQTYADAGASIEAEHTTTTDGRSHCSLCGLQQTFAGQAQLDLHRGTRRHSKLLHTKTANRLMLRCDVCGIPSFNSYLEYAQHLQGQKHRDLHFYRDFDRMMPPPDLRKWRYWPCCDRWSKAESQQAHIEGRRHQSRMRQQQQHHP